MPDDRGTGRAIQRWRTQARHLVTPLALRGEPLVSRLSERLVLWRDAEANRFDRSLPLPPGAREQLRPDNPRLVELLSAYEQLDWPVVSHSRWERESVEQALDLERFRGENHFIFHYRDSPALTRYRFFVFLQYLERTDDANLLGRLEEDGAFGCFTLDFPDRRLVSRDLLDAVNELNFLERYLDVLSTEGLRVLDIGAGYGRLAHRGTAAGPKIAEWCCVDAIGHSTFLSEWYLRFRGADRAHVVPLHEIEALQGPFDLACNVHSFSECTSEAIAWWVEQLLRLDVPKVFVVPNEPEGFLSTETDGSRRDFAAILESGGYALEVDEPAIADPAVRQLFGVADRHCIFSRR